MKDFLLHTPGNTYFGPQSLSKLGAAAAVWGKRAVIITEHILHQSGIPAKVNAMLEQNGIQTIFFDSVGADTTADLIDKAGAFIRSSQAQMVLGLGGIKALSLAKAAAALTPSQRTAADFIDGYPLPERPLPYIEIPTTGRNPFMFTDSFHLVDSRNRISHICRAEGHFPAAIIFDSDWGRTLSERNRMLIAYDTLLYAIEGYFSRKSNFLSDSLFLKAIALLANLLEQGDTGSGGLLTAAQAGLVTGLGLSMSHIGMGGAVALVVNGRYQTPKSLIASIMLPYALEYGLLACPEKVARIAPIIGLDKKADSDVETAKRVIDTMRHKIGIQDLPMRLSDYEISRENLPRIASEAHGFEYVHSLPSPISSDDILELLKRAY